ncbi:MAG: magnesium transporter [Planctomycetes bacterium]|nr:magnesium transporter [Planctomycetota bacterium]
MSDDLTLVRTRQLLREPGDGIRTAFETAEEDRRLEIFLQLEPLERAELLGRLAEPSARFIMERADSTSAARAIEALGAERARPLVAPMQPDEAADIVRRLPAELRGALLDGLPLKEEVQRLLAHPEGTAGALMNPRFVSVPEVVTVSQALDTIRHAARAETINYIYVVDSGGRLIGTLSVRNLLVASPGARVSDIATKRIAKLAASATEAEIGRTFQTHRFQALPVVDDRDRLIGIVTLDDAMGTLREEEERMVYGVTGIRPREHLIEGMRAARGRIPWITVTIAGGLLCAAIGTIFKRTLQEIVVLGLFVPLVLAIGESVSSQTTAIVMKALAGGAVERTRLAGFFVKELAIGLALGVYAAAIVGGLTLIWSVGPRVALTVAVAVSLSVTWAAVLGVAIPYVLRRTRVDPSIAGGPVVLLLCDLSTLVIYLGGAQLVLL